jgi:hypothetical protein
MHRQPSCGSDGFDQTARVVIPAALAEGHHIPITQQGPIGRDAQPATMPPRAAQSTSLGSAAGSARRQRSARASPAP